MLYLLLLFLVILLLFEDRPVGVFALVDTQCLFTGFNVNVWLFCTHLDLRSLVFCGKSLGLWLELKSHDSRWLLAFCVSWSFFGLIPRAVVLDVVKVHKICSCSSVFILI